MHEWAGCVPFYQLKHLGYSFQFESLPFVSGANHLQQHSSNAGYDAATTLSQRKVILTIIRNRMQEDALFAEAMC